MRVIVIGNSHVGAIKLGWDALDPETKNGVELDFFAAPQPMFRKLEATADGRFGAIEGTALKPDEETRIREFNGTGVVDLTAYDRVLGVGMHFNTFGLPQILATHDIDEIYETGKPRRISREVFRRACLALVAEGDSVAWCRAAAGRTTILQRPRIAVSLTKRAKNPKDRVWLGRDVKMAQAAPAFDLFEAAVEEHLARQGVALLRQPRETLAPEGLTRADLTSGSVRLFEQREHQDADFAHMNTEYGTLCLRRYLESLAPAAAEGATASA